MTNEISQAIPSRRVLLTVETAFLHAFHPLLQEGFRLEGQVGCSVRSFLCDQAGLDPEYLEKRIQTIFLDGKPVDDVETAMVRNGATLSLSASLPGLVGAVMRKAGYYARFRDPISYRESMPSQQIMSGSIIMKLFNLPLTELGASFLERGIWIEGSRLHDVLLSQKKVFRSACRHVLIGNRPFDADTLMESDLGGEDIFLQVKLF